ncbi:MAG: zinc dependent phospholipase C family protein [Clostridia bacterium]|nr:zinc dependent phospholipase C family protein [Clostridia bacterium]
MPDIIVHTGMGREVLSRLGLRLNADVYRFGLLGPDPFLFYRFYVPPFWHAANRYSSVMHRERTGDFLAALALRCREEPELFAYLAGFLCHYALDSAAHPFILRKANHSRTMHMAIEHRLDTLYGGEIDIPPFLPERLKAGVGGCIGAVYGWSDAWEKLQQGHADMFPFYRLAGDRNGTLNRLLGCVGASALSYRSRLCDSMDLSGFWPLYRKAVGEVCVFIPAAEAFVRGETTEEQFRSVVGSRSYIDG